MMEFQLWDKAKLTDISTHASREGFDWEHPTDLGSLLCVEGNLSVSPPYICSLRILNLLRFSRMKANMNKITEGLLKGRFRCRHSRLYLNGETYVCGRGIANTGKMPGSRYCSIHAGLITLTKPGKKGIQNFICVLSHNPACFLEVPEDCTILNAFISSPDLPTLLFCAIYINV